MRWQCCWGWIWRVSRQGSVGQQRFLRSARRCDKHEDQGQNRVSQAVDRLRRETGDTDIRRLFEVASALQVKFYEDWQSGESVAEALDDVECFVNKLDPLVLGD